VEDGNQLKSMAIAKPKISKIIKQNGLNELGAFYHQFPKGGFTGIVCLVESHLAIHTWPEFNFFTLDVYVCNYSKNNNQACHSVFNEIVALFNGRANKKIIKR